MYSGIELNTYRFYLLHASRTIPVLFLEFLSRNKQCPFKTGNLGWNSIVQPPTVIESVNQRVVPFDVRATLLVFCSKAVFVAGRDCTTFHLAEVLRVFFSPPLSVISLKVRALELWEKFPKKFLTGKWKCLFCFVLFSFTKKKYAAAQ